MRRALGIGLVAATNALGAAAFLYPFFLPGRTPGEGTARAADAPVLFALLGPLMLAIAIVEVRRGRLDARHVALLGVLSGLNAVLRLPGSFAGANLMFFLPIACGYVFGPSFGFLLGASSMAVSAIVTGGVGPWLPFEMWAMGWVGAGAAIVRPLRRTGAAVAGLAAYGWLAGMLYGAVTNLWFWPFLAGSGSDVSWQPGLGALGTARHYWRFYLLTSLAWDSARAIGNVVLVVVFARPALRLLERFRARLGVAVFEADDRRGPGANPQPGSDRRASRSSVR